MNLIWENNLRMYDTFVQDHTCVKAQDTVFWVHGVFRCTPLVEIVGESLDFLHYNTQWLEYCLSPRKPFVSWQHFLSALVDSKIKSSDGIPAVGWMKNVCEQSAGKDFARVEKHTGEMGNNAEVQKTFVSLSNGPPQTSCSCNIIKWQGWRGLTCNLATKSETCSSMQL